MTSRILIPLLLLSTLPLCAAEWSQYRGPSFDGSTPEKIAPWPAGGPKVLWKVQSPGGFSSFAVGGTRCFTIEGREAAALARLRPGVDGVIFEYCRHHSTFLPEAWGDAADPAEFMAQLKYKAGLPPDFWDFNVKLSRFTVSRWDENGLLHPLHL